MRVRMAAALVLCAAAAMLVMCARLARRLTMAAREVRGLLAAAVVVAAPLALAVLVVSPLAMLAHHEVVGGAVCAGAYQVANNERFVVVSAACKLELPHVITREMCSHSNG